MKVRTKLITGFSCLMAILFIMDVWSFFSIRGLSNGVDTIDENLQQLDLVSRLQLIKEKMLASPHDYYIHGEPTEKETFTARYSLFEKMLAGLEKTDLTGEERNTLDEIKSISSEINEIALQVLDLELSTIGDVPPVEQMMKQIDALSERLDKNFEALSLNAFETTTKALFQSKTSIRSTNKFILYCTLLIFLNALAVGLFILSIIKPIKLLQEGVEVISHGRFDHRVHVHSQDELRDLADAFNKMVGNFEKCVVDIEGEKEKLETVLLDIGVGVMVGDARYNLLYMNPIAEKIFGKSCKDLQGKDFFGCHEEGDKVMRILESDQLPVSALINYDSKVLHIDAAAIKNPDDDTPIGYTMTVRDVTEQERMVRKKLEVL